MSNTQVFKNKRWTSRDYFATNLVACVIWGDDEFYPNPAPRGDCWEPVQGTAILNGLTLLHKSAGVEYYGYL